MGQTSTHCPQKAQALLPIGRPKAGVAAATNDVSGLIAKSIAEHAEDQKQK